MLSLKNKRILVRIISFGLLCAYFGFAYALIVKGILGELKEYPGSGSPYEFSNAVITTTIGAFIVGLLFGVFEIYFLERLFLKTSLSIKLNLPVSYSVAVTRYSLGFSSFIEMTL